jgi:hypothetical protein
MLSSRGPTAASLYSARCQYFGQLVAYFLFDRCYHDITTEMYKVIGIFDDINGPMSLPFFASSVLSVTRIENINKISLTAHASKYAERTTMLEYTTLCNVTSNYRSEKKRKEKTRNF